jgi:hypothetical protein
MPNKDFQALLGVAILNCDSKTKEFYQSIVPNVGSVNYSGGPSQPTAV